MNIPVVARQSKSTVVLLAAAAAAKSRAQLAAPRMMKDLRPKRSIHGPRTRLLARATIGKAARRRPLSEAESPSSRPTNGRSGIIITTLKLMRKKPVHSTPITSMTRSLAAMCFRGSA
jgi:hypothetical protein